MADTNLHAGNFGRISLFSINAFCLQILFVMKKNERVDKESEIDHSLCVRHKILTLVPSLLHFCRHRKADKRSHISSLQAQCYLVSQFHFELAFCKDRDSTKKLASKIQIIKRESKKFSRQDNREILFALLWSDTYDLKKANK
jgi:hypothetical protein